MYPQQRRYASPMTPSTNPPTKRQRDALAAIRAHMREHGMAPTRSELARALGLKNASGVTEILLHLQLRGLIEVHPRKQRAIKLLDDELPVVEPLGEIAAGEPIIAPSRTTKSLPLVVAEQFSPSPDYFLRVRGNSMNRVVNDGDLVAIRADATECEGKIVVARIEGEVTLKRLRRIDAQTVELRPESTNPEHQPRRIDVSREDLQIDGYVVGALLTEPESVDPPK